MLVNVEVKDGKKKILLREELQRRLSCQIRRGFDNDTKNTCGQKEVNTNMQRSQSLNTNILLPSYLLGVLQFQ